MSTLHPSRTTPTLADAAEATLANLTLTPRQRQDRLSAIRTVARVIGRNPTDIPADPRLLGRRLAEISPAAHGIGRARWANLRSLVRAAVAEVTDISPGRHQNALTPSWQSLWGRLPGRRQRGALSRLMHFCAHRQIEPESVDQRVFDAFAVHLQQSLLAKPKIVERTTITVWNEACRKVAGWPAHLVPLPERADRYSFLGPASRPGCTRRSWRGSTGWLDGICWSTYRSGPFGQAPYKPGSFRCAASPRHSSNEACRPPR